MLSDWVQAGGNLIAMRPDDDLAGLLGLTDTGAHARQRLSGGRHVGEPRRRASSATRSSTTARPTATRRAAPTTVATLYSDATTATPNPAVTLRSVGSNGGQAAAFTYDLARSIVYTRQGNPAWAGQDARRRERADPLRRPLLRQRGRRPAARLGRPQQGRDPAGRRAAAPAHEPDRAHERRPQAAAAVLVPAAVGEGGGRDDRRRSRQRRHRSGASTSTRE